MTMNANSSLATYGQLPEESWMEPIVQKEDLFSRVAVMRDSWWRDSDGLVRDITVDEFHTDGRYRIAVDFDGTVVYFPDEDAAAGWIERMVQSA